MRETKRVQSVVSESAVLARVLLTDSASEPPGADPLEELTGLAVAAGAKVVGGLCQRRERPDITTYLGKGKLEELRLLVESEEADVVLFDNDLTPAQTRNLEKALGVKVLDRSELILDIFASHAQTYEARLAVELAQLEYTLPRLKRMWTHLSRLKMGIGMRGPGEKQIEVDRRLAEKRIYELRHELAVIEKRKAREVAARREHMTVSLVGYTNAGKSTLMNALTGAGVKVEDRLFATLDTRTRRWQLPRWGPVLLSDTVGFIRDLPHHLIASFRATLEEARQADLLLHVADAGNPAVNEQIAAVYGVLGELGIQEKDTVLVLNKIDKLPSMTHLDALLRRYSQAVAVSAKTGVGLERLGQAVSDAFTRNFVEVELETSVDNGRLLAFLASHGEVLAKEFTETRVSIRCRLPQKSLGRLEEPQTVVLSSRRGGLTPASENVIGESVVGGFNGHPALAPDTSRGDASATE